jgi:hypothetical protein
MRRRAFGAKHTPASGGLHRDPIQRSNALTPKAFASRLFNCGEAIPLPHRSFGEGGVLSGGRTFG